MEEVLVFLCVGGQSSYQWTSLAHLTAKTVSHNYEIGRKVGAEKGYILSLFSHNMALIHAMCPVWYLDIELRLV